MDLPTVRPARCVVCDGDSASATAAPPTEASGDFAATSTTINGVRFAGPNVIIDLTYTVSYTGTLVGTSVVKGTLIAHGSDAGNFHGTETFTGTVNGIPGTLTFNLVAQTKPSNAERGKATIVGATGELAWLHGVLFQDRDRAGTSRALRELQRAHRLTDPENGATGAMSC
jgi:hypothetical protein